MRKLDAVGIQGNVGKASVETIDAGKRNRRDSIRIGDLGRVVNHVCKVEAKELEESLRKNVEALYHISERRVEPLYPWVLIRCVPKEQVVGGIIMADNVGEKGQNKPLFEGIVLTTWKPFVDVFKMIENEEGKFYKEMKSALQPGDRVVYPSFAGMPVNFLDETKYRLVREWTFDVNGGIMGKVSYAGENRIREKLDELFKDLASVTLSGK